MPRSSPVAALKFLTLGLALSASVAACGLKGPPLPPLAATPEESDRQALRASPKPSASPKKKNKPTSQPTPETR